MASKWPQMASNVLNMAQMASKWPQIALILALNPILPITSTTPYIPYTHPAPTPLGTHLVHPLVTPAGTADPAARTASQTGPWG